MLLPALVLKAAKQVLKKVIQYFATCYSYTYSHSHNNGLNMFTTVEKPETEHVYYC